MKQTTDYNPPQAWRDVSPVDRAAHLFECYYPVRAREVCREEGISDADAERGEWLTEQRRDLRRIGNHIYGRPEYGSWPSYAHKWFEEELAKRIAARDGQ